MSPSSALPTHAATARNCPHVAAAPRSHRPCWRGRCGCNARRCGEKGRAGVCRGDVAQGSKLGSVLVVVSLLGNVITPGCPRMCPALGHSPATPPAGMEGGVEALLLPKGCAGLGGDPAPSPQPYGHMALPPLSLLLLFLPQQALSSAAPGVSSALRRQEPGNPGSECGSPGREEVVLGTP